MNLIWLCCINLLAEYRPVMKVKRAILSVNCLLGLSTTYLLVIHFALPAPRVPPRTGHVRLVAGVCEKHCQTSNLTFPYFNNSEELDYLKNININNSNSQITIYSVIITKFSHWKPFFLNSLDINNDVYK